MTRTRSMSTVQLRMMARAMSLAELRREVRTARAVMRQAQTFLDFPDAPILPAPPAPVLNARFIAVCLAQIAAVTGKPPLKCRPGKRHMKGWCGSVRLTRAYEEKIEKDEKTACRQT